jgi:hypothetical protein
MVVGKHIGRLMSVLGGRLGVSQALEAKTPPCWAALARNVTCAEASPGRWPPWRAPWQTGWPPCPTPSCGRHRMTHRIQPHHRHAPHRGQAHHADRHAAERKALARRFDLVVDRLEATSP